MQLRKKSCDVKPRRLPVRVRRRGRHRENRPKFTRDELISYLKRRNIRSSRKLSSLRSRNTDPALWDYIVEFGKWSEAVKEAFGVNLLSASSDRDYLVRVVRELRIESASQYRDARRKRPHAVPSFRKVERHFGSWSRLKFESDKEDILSTMNNYRSLVLKLGRFPVIAEAENMGIHIRSAIKFFGSKRTLDRWVAKMEGSK